MPADRDRAYLGRADRLRRLRLGGRDQPERRRRGRPARPQPAPKVAAVGPGTAETLRKHGIEPAFVASVSTADASRRRVSEAGGQGRLPRGRELAARPDRRPRGRLRPALQHRAASARPARGRRRRPRLGLGGARLRVDRRRRLPAVSIGPETTRVAESVGLTVAVEATRHDLDGLVAAIAAFADSADLMYDTITFLTDFGLRDDYVGVCHGVMKRIARDVEILDISHGIAAAGGDPGRARARALDPLSAGGRPPRRRRPGCGRRPARGRDPDRRGSRLRRSRQRAADDGRRPGGRRGGARA